MEELPQDEQRSKALFVGSEKTLSLTYPGNQALEKKSYKIVFDTPACASAVRIAQSVIEQSTRSSKSLFLVLGRLMGGFFRGYVIFE